MNYLITEAIIHSLDGKRDLVDLLGEAYYFNIPLKNHYIFRYKGNLVRGIFNTYNFMYYVDDLYGILPDYDENYVIYSKFLGDKTNEQE